MNRRESLKILLAAGGGILIPSSAFGFDVERTSTSRNDSAARQGERSTHIAPVFSWLTTGEVKPAGWIKEQMVRDLQEGFAGRLGDLCHEASSDIFVSHRNSAHTKNNGNRDNSKWWNGETEGNWRAGFIQMAYLTEDPRTMREADAYVRHILSSQGFDGYLGIYAADSRFMHPGELWTQACLLRGLVDYAQLAGNRDAMNAVKRSADLTVSVYGSRKTPIPWGESHDLMISDVMERLYDLTGDLRYRDFSVLLYRDWSRNSPDADTSLTSLLNLNAPFTGHGAHTYESIRVPLWLSMATGSEDLTKASRNALMKLAGYTEISGSAVSQEDIDNLKPDPTYTEYEYCGTKEIQFTLESALQKTGIASIGDRIEKLWFNAAQGSRTADGRAITYLTPDNRLKCNGRTPDDTKPQPRNKFSPTHADVAVCCNPNATNVAAMYVRGMWMRHRSGALAALLYGPCHVSTRVRGVKLQIEEKTNYPFENTVEVVLSPERQVELPILLRDPGWSRGTTVTCAGAHISRVGGYWRVNKRWSRGDAIKLKFTPIVEEVEAVNREVALQYGPLLFARPLASNKIVTKNYPVAGFQDAYYEPATAAEEYKFFAESHGNGFGFRPVRSPSGADWLRPFDAPVVSLRGEMTRKSDGQRVDVDLVPLGNAPFLRRLTHPVS
ncbi:MAG: beta-L-arabinofuranosidase domain-containing protein [Acidobacteriaceae bacterium]